MSIAALAAGSLIVATSVPVHAAASQPGHSSDLPRQIVGLHNRERSEVGARPLVWDAALAAAATAYARTLDERDRGLAHSPRKDRPGQGENLWMGTSGRFTVARMFGGWSDEKRFFRPGLFPNIAKGVAWPAVGHYTQIIWRDTERVGCGIRKGARWDYLVCRYAPAGNIIGQPVP
jgi:hypothetical protein